MGVDYLTSNYETVCSTPELFKTGQITPTRLWNRGVSFLFISAESLKNHSKSQKNYKIENLILLDSTWVDIYSEYIIWYALVQSFRVQIIEKNRSKFTAKTLY
jgi:hypothetical protein